MSYMPSLSFDLSPVRFDYIGALRGLAPRSQDNPFVYVLAGAFDPEVFVCLAASNPQGRFYGVITNDQLLIHARNVASDRSVSNVSFVQALSAIADKMDYLCADYSDRVLPQPEREALFEAAQKGLKPGGFFCYRYRAYENPDEILQFLINEYEPNLSKEQGLEFLQDIKALGTSYFVDHPIARAALEKAVQAGEPASFFEACRGGDPDQVCSGTFETMEGLLPREFSFAGDADYSANYIELAAPAAAHGPIDKCRGHLLYEPIKDFALQRLVRNDVWVKRPVEQTFDNPTLFGGFTFGVTTERERVPTAVPTQAGVINLSTPLFVRLIDLMSLMPVSVGDFLAHPSGVGMNPDDVVASINVLVACGVAHPMRGRYEGKKTEDLMKPSWSNSFNAYLDKMPINDPFICLSSSIIGSTVTLSAREALVLQAVNRVGLTYCAGILLPELKRLLQKNPSLATQIMGAPEPTDEVVQQLIVSVVKEGMPRWYAYGLLAA